VVGRFAADPGTAGATPPIHVTARHRRAALLRTTALLCIFLAACSGSSSNSAAKASQVYQPGVIRYRLKLRRNPVDPGEAFRCYGRCQQAHTPKDYVQCLSACPGFEHTPGFACDAFDVPPESACLTVRTLPSGTEPDPGLVVLAVVGNVLLVVGLASLCASSRSQCYSYAYPPPF
jgi:hypothetical protein